MPRKPMLAGNWKMHKTIKEAIDLTVRLKYACESLEDRDVVVCPSYTALQAVSETLSDSEIEVGAQNMHDEVSGAYTGEVSPGMVEDAGADWVIIGHSERRELFGEGPEFLRHKIAAANDHGLKTFYCVGENLEEREAGRVESVIRDQLETVLSNFSKDDFEELVVAYEPLWAIGTGEAASPNQANDAHSLVRETLGTLFDDNFAETSRVVYGGSVKPHNVSGLMDQPELDGALVGSASLKAEDFAQIVQYDRDSEEIPTV